jgi:uncharacterized membrane protein YkoI
MIDISDGIFKLYPQVTVINGTIAYDADGNEVVYDLQAVTTKIAQDEADKITQEQAKTTAKASALDKLAALGLTQDEVKALVG